MIGNLPWVIATVVQPQDNYFYFRSILVEEVNSHQELPLGMAIYRANYVSFYFTHFQKKEPSHSNA